MKTFQHVLNDQTCGIVYPWSTFPKSKRFASDFLTTSRFLDFTKSAVRLLMKIIHLRVLILNSKRFFPQHSLTFWAGTQHHFEFFSQAASERSVVCVWMALHLSLFGKGARANISDRDDETRTCSSVLWCLCYSYVIRLASHITEGNYRVKSRRMT